MLDFVSSDRPCKLNLVKSGVRFAWYKVDDLKKDELMKPKYIGLITILQPIIFRVANCYCNEVIRTLSIEFITFLAFP